MLVTPNRSIILTVCKIHTDLPGSRLHSPIGWGDLRIVRRAARVERYAGKPGRGSRP